MMYLAKACDSLRIPVVPHKAVAEVQNRKPIGEIGCCESQMSEQKP